MGKNCSRVKSDSESGVDTDSGVMQKEIKNCKMSKSGNVTESPLSRPLRTHKKDLLPIKRVRTPGQGYQSIVEEGNYSSEEKDGRDKIQTQILAELRRMNERLEDVETQVAGCSKDKNIPKKDKS